MIMKHGWFIALAAGGLWSGAAGAFEVDFSKDSAEALFATSAGALPEISDGAARLPSRSESVLLPVVGGKKYKLEMSAETGGDFVVEKNDRAQILTLQSPGNLLASTYQVVFQNAAGGEVPPLGNVASRSRSAPTGFFLTNKRHPYVSVFYVPPEATNLQVRFQSNGRSTRIASLRLTEETAENAVIPNPDFRYGDLNYSGWLPQRDGRLYTRPDGKTVLHAGYGGTSPFFPLDPGTTYEITAIGDGNKGKATINIEYIDKNGASLLNRFLIRPDPKGAKTELTPPPGTVAGRLVTYGVILEEFLIRKVK